MRRFFTGAVIFRSIIDRCVGKGPVTSCLVCGGFFELLSFPTATKMILGMLTMRDIPLSFGLMDSFLQIWFICAILHVLRLTSLLGVS